jgi:hypothetical protein
MFIIPMRLVALRIIAVILSIMLLAKRDGKVSYILLENSIVITDHR